MGRRVLVRGFVSLGHRDPQMLDLGGGHAGLDVGTQQMWDWGVDRADLVSEPNKCGWGVEHADLDVGTQQMWDAGVEEADLTSQPNKCGLPFVQTPAP